MKIHRLHWRHYFGGVALVLLVVQLLTGIFLTLFYQSHLDEAYASVQFLYKEFAEAAWLRDSHRWAAFLLFAAIVTHITRSLLRLEFLARANRTIWLTGCLLLLPLLVMLVTGLILPWEWKAYWFMEMAPNYLGHIPVVGASLKAFLIDAFTMNRNFVAHVVILPVIAVVLVDIHIFSKLRKRKPGVTGYLLTHGLVTLPFFVVVAVLAVGVPMPSEDPEVIPMPLDGTYIPAPEWFILILFVPFMYFKGVMGPVLGVLLPFLLFLTLTLLPYVFATRKPGPDHGASGGVPRNPSPSPEWLAAGGFIGTAVVVLAIAGVFGSLYAGTFRSPTLGCNSCHNISMGMRMGVPPVAFKDRNMVPLLEDEQWMAEHWFYPQVVW